MNPATLLLSLLASSTDALSPETLIERAYRAAGGEVWRRPQTLALTGEAVFYDATGHRPPQRADRYFMCRVFPDFRDRAHAASGKVRIDAYAGGRLLIRLSFDGERTWNQDGPVPSDQAQREWSEAFGFGIIRFALEEGFGRTRLADDRVDDRLCATVRVTDPSGEDTLFWIDLDDYAIRKVGFRTPRGWHERVYSDFFRVDPPGWQQPGRVRLYYDGVLVNDIRWHQARINEPIPERLFRPPFEAPP